MILTKGVIFKLLLHYFEVVKLSNKRKVVNFKYIEKTVFTKKRTFKKTKLQNEFLNIGNKHGYLRPINEFFYLCYKETL